MTSLMMAMEDAVLVVAHAMYRLVGKGRTIAQLIKDICGVIVRAGDWGDREAYVALFEPAWHVGATRAIAEAVAKWASSFTRCLKECRFPIG